MNFQFKNTWLITGERGVGKTRFCSHLLEKAKQAGMDVAGVLSPPIFIDGIKKFIQVENIRNEETRNLASLRTDDQTRTSTLHWSFDEDALNWGNKVFEASVPCTLLIVDELGPLEFQRGIGWQLALTAIDSGLYKTCVVVIRPELLTQASKKWQGSRILRIPPGLDAITEKEILDQILSTTKP
jgi:nucleoside-triphosphatase THEP1